MRVQTNTKSAMLPYFAKLRLFLIKTHLKLLRRIAQSFTSLDQKLPQYRVVNCAGLELLIGDGVSNPAPLPGLHFVTLFKSSVAHIGKGAQVLEMGAGAGVWSLLCAQKGAKVSASDLDGIDLSGLQKSAHRYGKSIQVYNGDLFEKLGKYRFDHIFFNPPFHHAQPKDLSEQAYFGGQFGNVVARFLKESPHYLKANGLVWLILPKHEAQLHQEALEQWSVCQVKSIYLPLLGSIELFALSLKSCQASSLPSSRPMNPLSECFYQLSKVMNTHSCELLTIKGSIQNELLNKALGLTLDQNLLTRSTLVPKRDLMSYTWSRSWRWVSQHPRPPNDLHVEKLNRIEEQKILQCLNESAQWQSQIPPTILKRIWSRQALDPQQRPPFEFHLLQGESVSFFLIISPHLCTDAFAGTHLLNQIAKSYQDLIKSRHSTSDLDSQAMSDEIHLLSDQRSQSEDMPRSANSVRNPLEIDPLKSGSFNLESLKRCSTYFKAIYGIIRDFSQASEGLKGSKEHGKNRGETKILIKRIPKSELKSVLQGARQRKVKAHTLFSWGIAQAIQTWSKHRNIDRKNNLRLADLCTLRPLVDSKFQEEIDMLVQPYTHTINLNWSEQEALEHISSHLQAHKSGGITVDLFRSQIYRTLSRYVPLEKMMNFTFKRLFKTNITTTNPGPAPLKFTHFGEAQVLDFINFPQIAPPADIGIIYTTYNGELRIVTLYDESRWLAQDLDELIELLWDNITQLAQVNQASLNADV